MQVFAEVAKQGLVLQLNNVRRLQDVGPEVWRESIKRFPRIGIVESYSTPHQESLYVSIDVEDGSVAPSRVVVGIPHRPNVIVDPTNCAGMLEVGDQDKISPVKHLRIVHSAKIMGSHMAQLQSVL